MSASPSIRAYCSTHLWPRDVAGGPRRFRALGDDEMLVGKHSDLRQVRDDERLRLSRDTSHQRFADPTPDFSADALIDFVEHERRDDVVGCQHHFNVSMRRESSPPEATRANGARLIPRSA